MLMSMLKMKLYLQTLLLNEYQLPLCIISKLVMDGNYLQNTIKKKGIIKSQPRKT